jgi:hypothetical protein
MCKCQRDRNKARHLLLTRSARMRKNKISYNIYTLFEQNMLNIKHNTAVDKLQVCGMLKLERYMWQFFKLEYINDVASLFEEKCISHQLMNVIIVNTTADSPDSRWILILVCQTFRKQSIV